MVFSNLFFIYVFFPVCMLLYFVWKNIHWRNAVLMIFSLIFYAWGEPKCVLLMVGTVLLDYVFGLLIENIKNKPPRLAVTLIAVVVNIGCLGIFKYSDFIVSNINGLFGTQIPLPEIALPIGISFYTFQIVSYIVDVYRGDVAAQKSPFKLLLYISSFHQLIAGPIVRYKDIAAEIDCRNATQKDISEGIERFILGLAKKAILANMCGEVAANYMDGSVSALSVLPVSTAWFALMMYAFQIYFDFSAYSDMAIGMGRMCGFHYLENFNYPYISRSISEFWRRWHMSLGSFFRDYVYIPLGGNRCRKWRNILNLFIVWTLTGLWHGASWNFVLWGIYYFIFIAIEKLFLSKVLKYTPVLSNIYCLFVVVIGWGLFYYTDMSRLWTFMGALFGLNGNVLTDSAANTTILNNIILFGVAVVFCLPVVPMLRKLFGKIREKREKEHASVFGLIIKNCVLAGLLFVSTLMLVGATYNPFIYFRF